MSKLPALLLPCAGRSTRYPGVRPKWMLTLPDGTPALGRAVQSLPEGAYGRIVVAIRADHDADYHARALLERLFDGEAEIVVLDEDTRGPADTVARMIRMARVDGPVAIKDADSFFDAAPLPDTSFVAVSDVRSTPEMANIGGKSFAVVNENGLVVELVEKSLVSNIVCVGLYGLSDAAQFLAHFDALSRDDRLREIFVSHVFNRAVAAGEPVVPQHVSGLVDVGTLEDWRRYVRARGTIICDLDGVVFRNHSRYLPPYWDSPDEPIAANVATLRAWQDGGAQLVFMTARPESHRAKTMAALSEAGLAPHALIMDCRHGRRILVNDHARTNPFPAAIGISIERDAPVLEDYLKDWR